METSSPASSSPSASQALANIMNMTASGGDGAVNLTGSWPTTWDNSSGAAAVVATTVGLEDDTSRTARDWDDATWILTSSFIIFTMQSGFGMLESGCVSHKNQVNIMMKNVADVIFGGISYWMLGYGFSFGDGPGTNGFCGLGKFFLDPVDDASMGQEYSRFVFQASFATTATTIVSGAIAERARFSSYLIFSFFNTFIYCFPAHWVWAKQGWLNKMGVVDVAGDGPVHLVGGVSALIAAILMKPRKGRFTEEDTHEMESPVGAILGLFILWWSWLAFNCGSTYGISGGKWKVASRAATNTLMAANSGGIVAFLSSYVVHRKFLVHYVINGVLAALVSITACCAVTSVKESLIIGAVGSLCCLLVDHLMDKVKVDDPVSAFAVHGVGGMWGLLATGLFAHRDTVALIFNDHNGLVRGGGFYLLGVQALEVVSIVAWTVVTTLLLFKLIDLMVGLRLPPDEEELGADFVEHNVEQPQFPVLPPSPRAVHVNPAYNMDDETENDTTTVDSLCGLSQRRRSIFGITTISTSNGTLRGKGRDGKTGSLNGHVVSGSRADDISDHASVARSRKGSTCSNNGSAVSVGSAVSQDDGAVRSVERVKSQTDGRNGVQSVACPVDRQTSLEGVKPQTDRRTSVEVVQRQKDGGSDVERVPPQRNGQSSVDKGPSQKVGHNSTASVHKKQPLRRGSTPGVKETEGVDEIPLYDWSQTKDSSNCDGDRENIICVKL